MSNTPGAVDDATATTALYLMISTFRNFSIGERYIRELKWKPSGLSERSHDLTGHTLAILGLGGIGMRLATLARAFPMRIIYHSRHKVTTAPEWYGSRTISDKNMFMDSHLLRCEYFENVEEMLAETDVLSVHAPLNSETVGLVGEKWIRALKKGAIIINTARGKVVDEEAMIRALEDGHVSRLLAVSSRSKLVLTTEYSLLPLVSTSSPTNLPSIPNYLNSLTSRSCLIWELKPRIRSARWK